ncbi:MAG: cytochrome c [Deltaproteobacteria bacterium]|nr:cytochrome c [Deltaproteobacteria bacterium]
MKKLWVFLVVAVMAAPAAAWANPRIDFNAHCAKCHRANKSLPKTAKALGVAPAKLALRTSTMNREEMIAVVEKGREKMPGFEKELTKEQVTEIVDYIIQLKNRK